MDTDEEKTAGGAGAQSYPRTRCADLALDGRLDHWEHFPAPGVKSFLNNGEMEVKKNLSVGVLTFLVVAVSSQIATAEHDAAVTGDFLKTLPMDALLVSNLHTQAIYDPDEKKVGKVEDLLLDRSGKVEAVIISVGGFLGVGEKEVAVPFEAIKATEKESKTWLTIDATKDALKSAPGVSFDKVKGVWIVKEK
jgi:sporulation protein YlmC with PRC-barrel domain